MKKTIMFLGVLSLGLAHAQQGNVGINTDEPKATLEIKPTATNLAGTTNEGIVAPKLSKTRVADIAQPVEGTLVYVTDEAASSIASYTGSDVKVAKIDEKGYYFFDGTEWVKTKSNLQDQEWIYDPANKQIKLKRSGQAQGFVNKVYYNAETGQFFNKEDETLQVNGEEVSFQGDGYYYLAQKKSDKFNPIIIRRNNRTSTNKTLASYDFNVNEPSALARFIPTALRNIVRLLESNVSPTYWVPAAANIAYKYDNKSTNYLMGSNNSVSVYKGEISGYVTGDRAEAYINTPGKVASARGLSSFLSTGADAKEVTNFIGINSYAALGSDMAGGGFSEGISLIRSEIDYRTFNPNIPQLIGYHYKGIINKDSNANETVNHYGILIEDVDKAQNNYAIYTNAGKVRVGDLAGQENRMVVANNEGILTTDTDGSLTSKWTTGDNGTVKLKHLSDRRTARTDAQNIFINNHGKVGIGSANPSFKLDIADRIFADPSHYIVNGFGIRAFNSTWARGYNFMSEDKTTSLGGFQAYSTNGGNLDYFSIGADHNHKTIVRFYPNDFKTHFRGNVGVGQENPTEKLEVAGAIKIANSTDDTCDDTKAGTIRFNGNKFQGCTGDAWVNLH